MIPSQARVQTETINLERDVGRFEGLRFRVVNGEIYIKSARIRFKDGSTQDARIERAVTPSSVSPTVDLKGRDARSLAVVEVVYVQAPSREKPYILIDGLIGADPAGFEPLDTKRFDAREREVTLNVGKSEGRVAKIKLRAWEGPVVVRKAEIIYGNGEREEFRLRDRLEPGDQSDIIDVSDHRRGRNIRSVRLTLSPRRDDEKTRIDLMGLIDNNLRRPGWHGQDSVLGRDWTLLGSRRAAPGLFDKDVLQVGRGAGDFRSIRLRAVKGDLEIYGIRIVYGNGATEDVPMRGTFREGEITPPFDLRGRERFIDRIEMNYRSRLSFRGQAELEVWGKR